MKCASLKIQKQWDRHRRKWRRCERCGLSDSATTKVFGKGSLPADILFIGEGPGKTEDLLGKPFLGLSGKILKAWLRELNGRHSWCITNLVACRPCDERGARNRIPHGYEVRKCNERLRDIQALAQPRLVVLLGQSAATYYDPVNWNVPTLTRYHPSYILRQGGTTTQVNKRMVEVLLTGTRTHLEGAHAQDRKNPKAVLEKDSKKPYGSGRKKYTAKPKPLSRKV